MHLTEPPERFQTEDGAFLDRIDNPEDTDYETIYLREIDEERYLLIGEYGDGERDTQLVTEMNEKYVGLRPDDGERTNVPDDLQDAVNVLGYCIRADCVDDLERNPNIQAND